MADSRQPIKAIRGTRDILPPDSALFDFVEAQAREVFRLYDFQEIRTPILDRKSTRLNSSHIQKSRMPSSA